MIKYAEAALLLTLALLCFTNVVAQKQEQTGDLCKHVHCKRGGICVVGEDGNSTTCECPESCPSKHEPVCSVYYMDYDNQCEMHKVACRYGFFTAVRHNGKCSKHGAGSLLDRMCPLERLLEFHSRYLEWLMLAYQQNSKANLKKKATLDTLTETEKENIIMWEFDTRDVNKNDELDEHEVKRMVDQREGCMVGFLDACDFDGEPGISRYEWKTCFPTELEDLEEDQEKTAV